MCVQNSCHSVQSRRCKVMELKDKNILIISPFFFDYHLRIKEALEARGANVDVVDEQPSHSAVARILMRKDVRIYHGVINRYFDKVLTTLKKDYDFILFINKNYNNESRR